MATRKSSPRLISGRSAVKPASDRTYKVCPVAKASLLGSGTVWLHPPSSRCNASNSSAELFYFPTIADGDLGRRLPVTRTDGFNLLDQLVAPPHWSKNEVLAFEWWRRCGAEKKLRAVRVRPSVRHRKGTGAEVLARLAFEGLVGELSTVDRLAAPAVAEGEVTPL